MGKVSNGGAASLLGGLNTLAMRISIAAIACVMLFATSARAQKIPLLPDQTKSKVSFTIQKTTGTPVIPGTYTFSVSCSGPGGNTGPTPVTITLPGSSNGAATVTTTLGNTCTVTEVGLSSSWGAPVFTSSGGLAGYATPGDSTVTVGPVKALGGVLLVTNKQVVNGVQFRIRKTTGTPEIAGTYTFSVSCTGPGGPTGPTTVITTLPTPGSGIVTTTVGSICTVTETSPSPPLWAPPGFTGLGGLAVVAMPAGGWTATVGPVQAGGGELVVTNRRVNPGTLNVRKIVANNTGGPIQLPPTFSTITHCQLSPGASVNTPIGVPGNQTVSQSGTLAAGTVCSVTEINPTPFTVLEQCKGLGATWTIGYSAPVTIVAGQASTLTVTNTLNCDQPKGGALSVQKIAVNNLGVPTPLSFTMLVTCQGMPLILLPVPVNGTVTVPPTGQIPNGTVCTLGEYPLQVPGVKACPSGTATWVPSNLGPLTIYLGQTTTAIVTNTLTCNPVLPMLSFKIQKSTGATVLSGTYTFNLTCTVGGVPVPVQTPVQIMLPGTGAATISVPSGAVCNLAEQSLGAGWNAPVFSGSGGLTVLTSSGMAATFGPITGTSGVITVTNQTKPGTVTVIKILVPDNDPGKFHLQLNQNPGGLVNNFLSATNGTVMGPVSVSTPGNFNLSELATPGTNTNMSDYTSVVSGAGCAALGTPFTVTNGAAIVCTITNTRVPLQACTGWPLEAHVNIYNPMTPFSPQSVHICRGGYATFHNQGSGATTIQHVNGPTTIPTIPLPNNTTASTIPLPTAGVQEYKINGFTVNGFVIVH